MESKTKRLARIRRHHRVRKQVSGSQETPRLAVYRSNRHIYAQLIDDIGARTLAAASDAEIDATGDKTARAKAVGELLAKRAKEAGV
jgi:large subunit ribosomal protein L18